MIDRERERKNKMERIVDPRVHLTRKIAYYLFIYFQIKELSHS